MTKYIADNDNATRHSKMADQLAPLLAWMRRPELDEPVTIQSNWQVAPTPSLNVEDYEGLATERRLEITPSIEAIMRNVETNDIERNEKGQIIRIGTMQFSDGTQTEKGYVMGIDGDVILADIRMPTGALLGAKEKADAPSGNGDNPQEATLSNAYFADMLKTAPQRYVSGKRNKTKGRNISAEEAKSILAQAYANTDMSKVAITKCPDGLPCGSRRAADSFLGMRKTTCAGNGAQGWEDISTALVNRDMWAETVASLSERDVAVLDSAAKAGKMADIFGARGGASKTEERRGKRLLRAANDNLAEFMKIFAA